MFVVKKSRAASMLLFIFAFMFVLGLCAPTVAYASQTGLGSTSQDFKTTETGGAGRVINDNDSLTALFRTRAFQGSMSTISKIPFLGTILTGIISVGCFMGLFLIAVGVLTTILYLTNRSIFDRVHELKSAGRGQRFFGVPTMAKEIFQGNYGTGLDAIVSFFLMLLPDVKEYSYCKENSCEFNLSDNETVTTCMLKISLPTIMAIFFFSIGFNGVYLQLLGNFADAMGTAAGVFVETDLTQCVERALNTGAQYQFAFSAAGTPRGEKCQDIASELYRNARRLAENVDSESQITMGSAIDAWVTENFYQGGDWVGKLGFKEDDAADFDNMKFEVIVNNNPGSLSAASNVYDQHASIDDVFGGSGSDLHVHVLVQRVVKHSAPNSFILKQEKTTTNVDQ